MRGLRSALMSASLAVSAGGWVAAASARTTGSATMYFSSSTIDVAPGQVFSVDARATITGNPHAVLDVVGGSYDNTRLDLLSISGSGSPFDHHLQSAAGGGYFADIRFAYSFVTGDVLLDRTT